MAWSCQWQFLSCFLRVSGTYFIFLLLLLPAGGKRRADLAVVALDGAWDTRGWLSWAVDEGWHGASAAGAGWGVAPHGAGGRHGVVAMVGNPTDSSDILFVVNSRRVGWWYGKTLRDVGCWCSC